MIKKVTEDIESLRLNTCISAYMTFIKKIREDKFISKDELRIFLILLNPLAPHITSEMYEIIFGENIINTEWPKYDEKYLIHDEINLPIQINGKMKATILIDKNIKEKELVEKIKEEYPDIITGKIVKVIYLEQKIINIICE